MKLLYIAMFGLETVNKAIDFEKNTHMLDCDGGSLCDNPNCYGECIPTEHKLLFNMGVNIKWNKPELDLNQLYIL